MHTTQNDQEIGLRLSKNTNSEKNDRGNPMGDLFYITVPWSFEYYFTVRGSENFHIYLWIAKDLAWTQDSYYPAMIFGSLALIWCLVLAVNAIRERSIDELYMLVALFLWLSANFLWMAGQSISLTSSEWQHLLWCFLGEVFDGDDDYVVPRTANIMEVFCQCGSPFPLLQLTFAQSAIAWILLYHVVLRPLKIIPKDEHAAKRYETNGLKPRFSYFEASEKIKHSAFVAIGDRIASRTGGSTSTRTRCAGWART